MKMRIRVYELRRRWVSSEGGHGGDGRAWMGWRTWRAWMGMDDVVTSHQRLAWHVVRSQSRTDGEVPASMSFGDGLSLG